MAVNKYNFRWMYLQDFRTAVDYFAKILSEKVIPGFEGLPEEADALAQEVYKKLGMSFDPDHDDPADSAETAQNAGISFYRMASGMKQGIINLFTAGLYHFFEQTFFKFHRRELLWPPDNDKDPSLIKWRPAKDRLIKYYGIDIEKFNSWAKVNELRLLANTVKHADGDSCTELKGLRPDLFVSTHGQTERYELELVRVRPVLQPLAGEDVYINPEEFAKYVEAVKMFWEELATAFDGIE